MTVSLWDLALEKRKEQQLGKKMVEGDEENQEEVVEKEESDDSYIIVCGSKSSGKTSMVLRFLDRDEQAKPTTALEYTYGRRSKANSKQVAHIWELGGGTALSSLVHVAIQPSMLPFTSILIVIDLADPSTMWTTFETVISTCETSIEKAYETLKKSDVKRANQLKESWKRRFKEHEDQELMKPLMVPLAIIGGRYDVFQDLSLEKRRMICATMRFLAHYYGGSLQFLSMNVETLVSRARAHLNHLAFGTTANKTLAVDAQKPVFVPVGGDSFAAIGIPPTEGNPLLGNTPLELWKNNFANMFPQKSVETDLSKDDPAKDPAYAEDSIDKLRAHKDQELQRYVRQVEGVGQSGKLPE